MRKERIVTVERTESYRVCDFCGIELRSNARGLYEGFLLGVENNHDGEYSNPMELTLCRHCYENNILSKVIKT